MWRFILCLILLSCSTPTPKIITVVDSSQVQNLRGIFLTYRQVDSIKAPDSISQVKIKELKDKLSSMMEQNLNYQENSLEVKFMKDKVEEIIAQKNEIVKQIDNLRTKYEKSIRENEGIKYTLKSEIEQHTLTKKQKAELEKEVNQASVLNLASIKVIGMGYPRFGKRIPYETNEAKRIKGVLVSMTMPVNMLATKEDKKILVTMYSTDGRDDIKKDTTVYYEGKEHDINIYLSGKVFTAGKHLVNITINSKFVSEREFNIEK